MTSPDLHDVISFPFQTRAIHPESSSLEQLTSPAFIPQPTNLPHPPECHKNPKTSRNIPEHPEASQGTAVRDARNGRVDLISGLNSQVSPVKMGTPLLHKPLSSAAAVHYPPSRKPHFLTWFVSGNIASFTDLE